MQQDVYKRQPINSSTTIFTISIKRIIANSFRLRPQSFQPLKLISNLSHGDDAFGIRTELGAQAFDMCIDRSVVAGVIHIPDLSLIHIFLSGPGMYPSGCRCDAHG